MPLKTLNYQKFCEIFGASVGAEPIEKEITDFAKANPFNAKLRALMGSDIGHFDCVDMADVLAEAYELVDEGLMTEEDFRDFVFGNPVRLWGGANPDFFIRDGHRTASCKFPP